MKNKYSISSYNKHICLKMDYVMWSIFLFLLRPYLVLIFSFANMSDRMALIELLYTDRLMMSLGALAGIPAALLMYAWSRREPNASDFVRNLWRRGRELLIISTILNGFLTFIPLLLGKVDKVSTIDWLQFALSMLIMAVLYRYAYLKDCFLDFPSKDN